jgi:polyhydroxyalkanoic acid synthase PhaR subunit
VADQTSAPDPFAMWREWVSQSERQWNTFLNQAMGSESYSQSVGRFMEFYVAAQKQLGDTMGRYLTALNLPTRDDLLALGDRLAAIETRLARLEATLTRGGDGIGEDAVPAARPPRTRRPPAPNVPPADAATGAPR